MRRVKVYQLNGGGQWDDKGTGHVFLRHADEGDTLIISVQSEESGEELLEHKVDSSVEYQRQGDTIITWCELSTQIDLALSFQDVMNCNEVWEHVSVAQAKAGDLIGSPQDENRPLTSDEDSEPGVILPKEPELTNVGDILKKVSTAGNFEKDRVSSALMKDGYIRKLLDLFHTVEEQHLTSDAFTFFNLFKSIFLLNDVGIFEMIFNDDYVMDVIACLEYDPDHPPGSSYHRHRDFIKKAKFKNVIALDDDDVLQRIHQNYRVSYIKDVILLRYLDDPTLGTLSSIIFFNNVQIVTRFTTETGSTPMMRRLFAHLRTLAPLAQLPPRASLPPDSQATSGAHEGEEEEDDDDLDEDDEMNKIEALQRQKDKEKQKDKKPRNAKKAVELVERSAENRKDHFLFLQELVNIAKSLQVPTRDVFLKLLIELGLWTVIEDALVASSPKDQLWIWLACTEVIHNVIVHDAGLFRTFLVSRLAHPNSLLSRLFSVLTSDEVGSGLAHQLNVLMKMILDPESMAAADKDAFLDHIYAQQMPKFAAAVSAPSPGIDVASDFDGHNAKYHACELLCTCAQQHGLRFKAFERKEGILKKVSLIVSQTTGGAQLVCSAIRFLRAVIGTRDEFYNQRIVQDGLLDPVIDAFVKNGARYNLLNSVVIEMINHIKEQNTKSLVNYLISKHESKFQAIKYVDTFRLLKAKWEQNQEHFEEGESSHVSDNDDKSNSIIGPGLSGGKPPIGVAVNNAWNRRRPIDEFESEYAYFNEEDPVPAAPADGQPSPVVSDEKVKDKDTEVEDEKRFMEETNRLKRLKKGRDEDDEGFVGAFGNKRAKPSPTVAAKAKPAGGRLALGAGRGVSNSPSSPPGKTSQTLRVNLSFTNKRSSTSPPLSPPSPPLSPPSSPPATSLSSPPKSTSDDTISPLKKRRLSGNLEAFGQA